MKKLYIRSDMNNIIATGHVMRCLSIAEAGRIVGIESIFILADNEAVHVLESKGYKYMVLHTKWDNLDSEIDLLKSVIRKERIERLLIDTYQVTEKYLRALSEETYTIYLDDMNSFIYPVHAIICYANYWKKFKYMETYENAYKTGTIGILPKLYLGCEYAPLRQEFMSLPNRKIEEKISRFLIMSGGADPYNSIEFILNEIKVEEFEHIDVICGRFYNKIDELKKEYKEYENIQIHSNVSNLIDYMRQADLAISAGGSTLYELCAVGTPTISFSYADNQLDNVMQFEKDGIIDYLGDFRVKESLLDINERIDIIRDSSVRKEKSAKMRGMVDGNGALNIVNKIFV